MIDKPGIYVISEEEYHGNLGPAPFFSTGVCKDLIFKSPRHAWENHPALNPRYQPTTDEKFDIGHVAHALFLQGIDKVFVIEADDWRKKEAKEARDAARGQGKTPLLREQYDRVHEMLAAACDHLQHSELDVSSLAYSGEAEQSYVWQEGNTWLKVRPDWINHDGSLVIDYKTSTLSVNPETLARVIIGNGYDIQDALYKRGVHAITGKVPHFVFMFQEVQPPYLCSFVALPPEFVEIGRAKVEAGLMLWKQCMKSGVWPGYPTRVCYVDPPPWALSAWEMKRFAMEQEAQEEI